MSLRTLISLSAAAVATVALSGCAGMTEYMSGPFVASDSAFESAAAAPLGLAPEQVKLVSRDADGFHTNFVVDTPDGRMRCRVNGGTALTYNAINGTPTCVPDRS
jgi:hypothetical protein